MDVIVQGHSHIEGIVRFGDTLIVNPSCDAATQPHRYSGDGCDSRNINGTASAEIIRLG